MLNDYLLSINATSLKNLLSSFLGMHKRFIILTYHSFGNENLLTKGLNITISNDLFEKQCAYFKQMYNVISDRDLLDRLSFNQDLKSSLIITIDDGFKSSFSQGAIIAKKYNLPVTIFVSSSFIGNKRLPWNIMVNYLRNIGKVSSLALRLAEFYETADLANSLNEKNILIWTKKHYNKSLIDLAISSTLKDLNTREEELGDKFNLFCDEKDIKGIDPRYITIGSHTHTHPVMSKLSLQNQINEVTISRQILSKLIENELSSLAIPFGRAEDYNYDTITAGLTNKFNLIFTAEGYFPFHKNIYYNTFHRKNANLQSLDELRWALVKPNFLKNKTIGRVINNLCKK